MDPLADTSHAISLAIAPVFLLTSIATLLSVMSGRLSRIVDRRRAVGDRMVATAEPADHVELDVLAQRSRLIYAAIFSAVLSAFLVCLVIATAFVGVLASVDTAKPVAALFILAMAALTYGLATLLREIYVALQAGSHLRR